MVQNNSVNPKAAKRRQSLGTIKNLTFAMKIWELGWEVAKKWISENNKKFNGTQDCSERDQPDSNFLLTPDMRTKFLKN